MEIYRGVFLHGHAFFFRVFYLLSVSLDSFWEEYLSTSAYMQLKVQFGVSIEIFNLKFFDFPFIPDSSLACFDQEQCY